MESTAGNENTFEDQVNTLQSEFDTEIKNLIKILATNNNSLSQNEFFAKEGDKKGADAETKINYEAVNKKSLDVLTAIKNRITSIQSDSKLSPAKKIQTLTTIQSENQDFFAKLNGLSKKFSAKLDDLSKEAKAASELNTPKGQEENDAEDQEEDKSTTQLESLKEQIQGYIWTKEKKGTIGKAREKVFDAAKSALCYAIGELANNLPALDDLKKRAQDQIDNADKLTTENTEEDIGSAQDLRQ